jgi:lysophospholipase L1-like esterase
MRPQLVALGDSISCGEGVGIQLHRSQTWVAQVAETLGLELDLLARPGAKVRDVRTEQSPIAAAHPATLATVLIGLNDVLRSGFDSDAIHADLLEIATQLRAPWRTVLLARLHDPTAMLPLPRRLRAQFLNRVREVNSAVDAARGPGVVVVDLAALPALQLRCAWAVDRMHPGPVGHYAIATAVADSLHAAGFTAGTSTAGTAPISPPVPRGLNRRAEGRWLLRHGVPWVAHHLREVAVPLAGTLVGRGR